MDSRSINATDFRWVPIEDLPDDWESLASGELASLAPIWREQSQKLDKTGVLEQFNKRLEREWAIETGIIEGLYSIDRGITQLLIEKGIEASRMPYGTTDKPAEEIVRILNDQQEVLEGLFDFVAHRRELSVSYIKDVHAALTRNQHTVTGVNADGKSHELPLNRGEFKQHSNNPTRPNGQIHEYCPPVHVASEMDRLVSLHSEHNEIGVAPEVEAAWLHHRFAQIHPFQDGNGRLARALASLIFLRAGWFPLVISRDIRDEYIQTLERADRGELKPLVDLSTKQQKAAFLAALNISEDVLHQQVPVTQVITAAIERLKAKFEAKREEQQKVFEISRLLENLTFDRFCGVRDELLPSLTPMNENYDCRTTKSGEGDDYWFHSDIVAIAKTFKYFADTRTYRVWVRLTIREDRQTNILVSFHSVGRGFVGILGSSAFVTFKDYRDGESTYDGPYAICQEVFQFAFNEETDLVVSRYESWLNEAVLAGLDQWRRQL